MNPATHSDALWWKRPLRVLQTNLQIMDTPLMDAEEIAAETASLHANVLVINFGGIYAWYPSKVPFHHVNEYLPKDFDLMREILKECHARNIRVIARFDFSKAEDRAYQLRPEWFVRYADGSTRMYGKDRPGPWSQLATTCLNAGYRNGDVAVPVIREVLEQYDIDGVFFNAPHYEFCCCDACKEKYQRVFGEPMPDFPEYGPASPGLPDGLHPDWPSLVLKDNMNLLYQTVKERAPDLPVILYYNGVYADHLADRTATADMICTESQDILSRGRKEIPETWRPAISMRMGRTLQNYPVPFGIIHSCPGMDWRHTGLPTAEYEFWMSGVPANGGSIWHSVTGFGRTISDQRIYRSIRKINTLAERTADVMDGARSAAEILQLWDKPAPGFAEALLENQIPFDIACPEQLSADTLSRYRLVLLPESFRMTGSCSLLLKEYVENGGRLLLEGQKPGEILAEVLGVQAGMSKSAYLAASYLRVEDRAIADGFSETPLLPHRGETFYSKPLPESRVLATLVPPFSPLDGVGSPPERASILCPQTDIPLIVSHEWGKGKTLFLPFRLGHLIEAFGLPEHSALLQNLINLLLDGAPIFEMRAPSGVQATLFQKESTFVVHLVNGVGRRPLKENIPLRNLTFRLRAALPVLSVKALLEDVPLNVHLEQDGATITLQELGIWNTLLITCEKREEK